jgi:hypothetical protein
VASRLLFTHAFPMHARSISPLVEAYLVIEHPRQRLSHWCRTLAFLDDGRSPPLASVTAYYDPTTDQALLLLRYDELALGADRLAFLVETAVLAEIAMIQPAELAGSDRSRVVDERLVRCTLTVSDQRGVVGALTELSRRVREQKLSPKTAIGSLPAPPAAARASLRPRGTTEDPVLLVQPRSTRDDLQTVARGARDDVNARKSSPTLRADGSGRLKPPQVGSPHIIDRRKTPHRAKTVEMPASESAEMVAQLRPAGTEAIYARYFRGVRWIPVRVGALSLKGAALVTAALPRVHDHVEISFAFGQYRARVRGPVRKISSAEEIAASGASTFSVGFALDDSSRAQLVALLTAAREAAITIQPAPARGVRRFPVEWPLCLGGSSGTLRADALDVSRDGMFVRATSSLHLGTVVNFSMLLDDGSPPVAGRARVVRHIDEASAGARGLVAGYGLQILALTPQDSARWSEFLRRIEQRAAKRVLVGAAPERLAEMQATLAALGYVVTGGTDPGALAELAGTDRAVDAVLLDEDWLATGKAGSWLEQVLTERKVPCVTMGDPRRGRSALDKLLLV